MPRSSRGGSVTGPEAAPSFWMEGLGPFPTRPALGEDISVDVCIVGGGYTGLWTAYYLRSAAPDLSVAVIEASYVGFGASGRNGGWVSGRVAGLDRLMKDSTTRAAAVAMQREMYATIDEIERVVDVERIDCGWAHGGALLAATSPAQVSRLQGEVEAKHALGFDEADVRWLPPSEARRLIDPAHLHGAHYTPHCAAVDPARLVVGLARAVERAGAVIYESTPGVVSAGRVTVPGATITAGVVVDAREAYGVLTGSPRSLIPVYSLMVVTEPLGDDVWAAIGLRRRETFSDGRQMIVYGQRTEDGRIAFGGRGAPYHYGSAIRPEFDRDEATFAMLRRTLLEMFPILEGVGFAGSWGGPLAITRDWRPSVTLDDAGLARAGGYVGQGVSTANLAGRTLRDLILGRGSRLLDFPWVGHRSRKWEPEPLRWIGVNLGRKLTESIDRSEDRGRSPRVRQWMLDRLPVG
jgi:glycine/D-amino acid oxidase-like deaminating enzyme